MMTFSPTGTNSSKETTPGQPCLLHKYHPHFSLSLSTMKECGGGGGERESYFNIAWKLMAEGLCFFNKDLLVTRSPKKSPLVLRMVVVIFAFVCGMYIFSICLRQTNISTGMKFLNVQEIEQPCQSYKINQYKIPPVHFPNPKTFSRYSFSDGGIITYRGEAFAPILIGGESMDLLLWFVVARQECGCNPVRLFAIISRQRSGSGWFETLLNSHINVSSNGEIFGARDRRSNISMIFDILDKVYNLDYFTSASKNECSAAVGFKWMLNQGVMQYHKEIAEYFNEKGVSVILLFRRNLLRRMVSLLANSYDKDAKLLNGTHKSHVHSPHEAQVLAKYKPTINATLLLHDLNVEKNTAAKALDYFKSTRHILIYYEDIVSNHNDLMEVQKFLRLPYRKLSSYQVKIHTRPLSKQIENWGDVQKALKGTSFERFLHSDY